MFIWHRLKNKISWFSKIKNVKFLSCTKLKIRAGARIISDKTSQIILDSNLNIDKEVSIYASKNSVIKIGKNFKIGKGAQLYSKDNSKIIIGDNVLIGLNCDIGGSGEIEIQDNVIMASGINIVSSNHAYTDPNLPIREQGGTWAKVTIQKDSWIGRNAIILSGVNIGKHCVVGAGSVVTKSIPDYSVVGGNPAKIIKKYNFETKEWERIKK